MSTKSSKPYYLRTKSKAPVPNMTGWFDLQGMCRHKSVVTDMKVTRFLCDYPGNTGASCRYAVCPFRDGKLGIDNLEYLYRQLLEIESEMFAVDPQTGKPLSVTQKRAHALKQLPYGNSIIKQLREYLKTRKDEPIPNPSGETND